MGWFRQIGWRNMVRVATDELRTEAGPTGEGTDRSEAGAFRALVEAASDVIFRYALRPTRALSYITPSVEALTGYTPQQIVAAGFERRLLNEEDRVRFAAWTEDPSEPLVMRWRHRNGSLVWTETRGRVVRDDPKVALHAVARDITEQHEVEQRLRENSAALDEAQHLGAMGSWVWNTLSDRIEWSRELYRIYGLNPHAFAATFDAYLERIHPDDRDRVRGLISQATRDHQPFSFEERIIRPDGVVRTLRSIGRVYVDEIGRVTSMAGVCQDITEHRRAESAIREALIREREATQALRQIDAMRNDFLAAVSHDLRAPLSIVLGIADTLHHGDGRIDETDGKQLIQRLRVNARRLERMLDDLLDLDRLMRGAAELEVEEVDIGTLVRERVDASGLQRRRINIDLDHLTAAVDVAKVGRMVECLLSNVARHTNDAAAIWVRGHAHDDGVLVAVEDEGKGVPDEWKEAIFEPFRVGPPGNSPPGSGLGLAVVASIAELHGGRAWVEDRAGGGASFRVWLPASPRSGDAVPPG